MKRCEQCGKELNGRQKRYCSSVCKAKQWRTDRQQQEARTVHEPLRTVHEPFANGSSVTEPALVVTVVEVANKRVFHLNFTVTFTSDRPSGEWDRGLINISLRSKLEGLLWEYLARQCQGWKIEVKCKSDYDDLLSKHNGWK